MDGTKLRDVAVRRRLWEGGKAGGGRLATIPMIALARAVDPDARAIRKTYEDEIDSVVKKNHEAIAEARFAVQGRTTYPDATFTLRLSYGQVKGWKEGTREVPPVHHLRRRLRARHRPRPVRAAAELARGEGPARPRARRSTSSTTNDIIGGNSGSPVVNRNAEIVGLIFDGNIHSLGGEYGFDESVNRAVAVHSERDPRGARRRSTGRSRSSTSCGRAAAADDRAKPARR